MDNDSVSDGRRYRRKSDGNVYRIVAQARSPDGSVILRAVEGPGEIGTTNDRLAVDYEFFRVGEPDTCYPPTCEKHTQDADINPAMMLASLVRSVESAQSALDKDRAYSTAEAVEHLDVILSDAAKLRAFLTARGAP